ncbi:hypothetical protein PIROE2DRAFT_67320 [Piromyces sp. E2]|nr:hypothetical protein PIROE2DRAFT_67320 [Piromyces sp. E2]|eukprot:OUM64351.1 hypothetical protein PIROE2DRAFT_67320 [Piromyces sp. E2]
METKLIYQLINVIVAVLFGACGILNFVYSGFYFSFMGVIMNLYYIAFAVLIILIAFREFDIITREMHFLYSFFGRSLTYLFLGLTLWNSYFSFQTVASVLIIAVAAVYMVQYFKKAEPEF